MAKLVLSAIGTNFIQLLLDKGRLELLPQIAESYGAFADELSGVIRPTSCIRPAARREPG